MIYYKAMDNKTNDTSTEKKRGRPRSEKSRCAVLDATLRLVEESGGGKGVTMEAIARSAGVGKQTLYKWWRGTGDIFLEILREHAENEIVVADTPPDQSLEHFLVSTFNALKPTVRLILKALMAEAITDEGFRQKFITELILIRRDALSQVLNRSDSLLIQDKDVMLDFIYGLMWYRLLLDVGPLDADTGRKIARLLQEIK